MTSPRVKENGGGNSGGKKSSVRRVFNATGRTLRKMKVLPKSKSSSRGNHHSNYGAIVNDNSNIIIDEENNLQKNFVSKNANAMISKEEQNELEMSLSQKSRTHRDGDTQSSTVFGIERILRFLLTLIAVFMFGAYKGSVALPLASKILEYTLVAWLTCLLIIFVCFWRNSTHQASNTNDIRSSFGSFQRPTYLNRGRIDSQGEESKDIEDYDVVCGESTTSSMNDNIPPSLKLPPEKQQQERKGKPLAHQNSGNHPGLENLFIVKSHGGIDRVIPNEVYNVETDYCTGQIMMMIRTPDADSGDSGLPPGYKLNDQAQEISDYFRTKQRRFEYQFQIRLKKIPEATPYMGVEFSSPIKMGMIQKAVANTGLGFIRKFNKGFHYTLSGGDANGDAPDEETMAEGAYQLPHIAFPIVECMDRLIATKIGDPLPELGKEVFEDSDSVKDRKKGGSGNFPGWSTDYTYTMVVWSAYADFIKWKCVNIPGIRPFSISNLVGDRAMYMTMYIFDNQGDGTKPHYIKDKDYICSLELSNANQSLGSYAKEWLALDHQEGNNGLEDVEDDAEEDEDVGEELDSDTYIKSGDPVVLREASISNRYHDEINCVTNTSGFAVIQSQCISPIFIEKAGSAYQDGFSRKQSRSKYIASGDTIVIKTITDAGSQKYLSIHRGCWLKWVSNLPKRNGYFKIYTTSDSEGSEEPMQGASYISVGDTFILGHRRWSRYEVGASGVRSSKYCGRMLGLHKNKVPFEQTEESQHLNNVDYTEGGGEYNQDQYEYTKSPEQISKKRKKAWLKPLRMTASFYGDFSQRSSDETSDHHLNVDESATALKEQRWEIPANISLPSDATGSPRDINHKRQESIDKNSVVEQDVSSDEYDSDEYSGSEVRDFDPVSDVEDLHVDGNDVLIDTSDIIAEEEEGQSNFHGTTLPLPRSPASMSDLRNLPSPTTLVDRSEIMSPTFFSSSSGASATNNKKKGGRKGFKVGKLKRNKSTQSTSNPRARTSSCPDNILSSEELINNNATNNSTANVAPVSSADRFQRLSSHETFSFDEVDPNDLIEPDHLDMNNESSGSDLDESDMEHDDDCEEEDLDEDTSALVPIIASPSSRREMSHHSTTNAPPPPPPPPVMATMTTPPSNPKKKKKLLATRVAKSVQKGTTITGKQVVKGTIVVGKAISKGTKGIGTVGRRKRRKRSRSEPPPRSGRGRSSKTKKDKKNSKKAAAAAAAAERD